MRRTILNDPLGISLWNNGQFHPIKAHAILIRLEEDKKTDDAVFLDQHQIEKLEDAKQEMKDRFNDKYNGF
jgi:hypothetical protein